MLRLFLFLIVFSLSLFSGCCWTENCGDLNRNDGVIVSPTEISTEEAGSGEPQLPYYKPIWEE